MSPSVTFPRRQCKHGVVWCVTFLCMCQRPNRSVARRREARKRARYNKLHKRPAPDALFRKTTRRQPMAKQAPDLSNTVKRRAALRAAPWLRGAGETAEEGGGDTSLDPALPSQAPPGGSSDSRSKQAQIRQSARTEVVPTSGTTEAGIGHGSRPQRGSVARTKRGARTLKRSSSGPKLGKLRHPRASSFRSKSPTHGSLHRSR